MIDNRADAKDLVDTLGRPFEEIMEEAHKLDMDCGYLEGKGHAMELALPIPGDKEIKSRLALALDLDIKLNIRSLQITVNGKGVI